ncbi:unnamed protein product, partial [Musa textilis]
ERGIYRAQEDSNLGSKFEINLEFPDFWWSRRCHRLSGAVPPPVSVLTDVQGGCHRPRQAVPPPGYSIRGGATAPGSGATSATVAGY